MTAKEIAQWMYVRLQKEKYLYQGVVVYDIDTKFGRDFTYINEIGNLAIGRNVLKEFKSLTLDTVVWDRRERCWRMRENYDPLGKRQAD